MRGFEKVSFDCFKNNAFDDKDLYESDFIPKRSTKKSAGYDIVSLEDYVLKPNTSYIFKTGIKAFMQSDEVLLIFIRSSIGFKYDACLSNNVAVIDSDFYNNPENEGHIQVKLINHGTKDFVIKKFDRIAQGVFIKYLTATNEEDVLKERKGGIGSTNKENEVI